MIDNDELKQLLKEVEAQVKEFRHWFHEHPELSMQEKRTSEKIMETINFLDLPYKMVGECGIIAEIHGSGEGKTVLLRAEMDALPVQESEETLNNKKVCISEIAGISHACGHDAHMAMMLGAMLILNRLKDRFSGRVLFAFEQAEEIGGGILEMMEALKPYSIDTCFGIHVYAGLDSGKISVQPGERMAALSAFTVKVKGRGGHASRPDLTINPLMCTAHILVNLNSIWTGEINPTKTVTLGIGSMKCGEKGNVIADEAVFAGTMRYFDVIEGEKAFKAVQRVCQCVAEAHRCSIEYERILQGRCAVVNDELCSKRAEESIINLLGEEVIARCDPWFATESMSLYLSAYPGVLAFLGISDLEHGFGAGHHTKEFDMDESVLIKGTSAAVKYTLDSLEAMLM